MMNDGIVKLIGELSMPSFIAAAGAFMLVTKCDATDAFISGARSGFASCIRILPGLILLIVAVNMFSASGALDIACMLLKPLANIFRVPTEILPIIIMRPISGSGTTAMMQKLLTDSSPDSFAGRCASIIMGSSDTIIYTLTVYFGSVNVKNTRHAMLASFAVLLFCVWVSVLLTNLFF